MKAYGMQRRNAGDLDCAGCRENGHKTSCYNIKKAAYRSLRNGKKAAIRRHIKRKARATGKAACVINQ